MLLFCCCFCSPYNIFIYCCLKCRFSYYCIIIIVVVVGVIVVVGVVFLPGVCGWSCKSRFLTQM